MSSCFAPTSIIPPSDYFDGKDSELLYRSIVGGEHKHIGIYESSRESISKASQRTVELLTKMISHFPSGSRVLDLNMDFGTSARFLAREKKFGVTCLNPSKTQSSRIEELNRKENLSSLVDTVEGAHHSIPFSPGQFNIVWSQDTLLLNKNRKSVFEEVNRVLKPGGSFVFTNILQGRNGEPLTSDGHQDWLNTVELDKASEYLRWAGEFGWLAATSEIRHAAPLAHFSLVFKSLASKKEDLKRNYSENNLDRMLANLRCWIEAGTKGSLSWGIFHFRKQN